MVSSIAYAAKDGISEVGIKMWIRVIGMAVVLIVLPIILGTTFCKCIGEKEVKWAKLYVSGYLTLFLMFALIAVPFVFMNLPFMLLARVFGIALLLVTIGSIVFSYRQLITMCKSIVFTVTPWSFLIGVMILLQIAAIIWYQPDAGRDYTLETVVTAIQTNTMYAFHPATGAELILGFHAIGKLVVLPFFYSVWIALFALPEAFFVYTLMPLWLLLAGYMVFCLWACLLWPKSSLKRKIFLFAYGLLQFFGNYSYMTSSYHLMHNGYQGESIVLCVLMPYVLYLLLCKKSYLSMQFRVISIIVSLAVSITITDLGIGLVFLSLLLFAYFLMQLFGMVRRTYLWKRR